MKSRLKPPEAEYVLERAPQVREQGHYAIEFYTTVKTAYVLA